MRINVLGDPFTFSTVHGPFKSIQLLPFQWQWRIQDFPEEGAVTPKGIFTNLLFAQFSPKTAGKWRNFGPEGGRGNRVPRVPPLRSATEWLKDDLYPSLSHKSLADPGFGQGEPRKFFPRFCQCSEVESGEQSEPILAGVQSPP